MEINNKHNERIMDSKDYGLVKEEIALVISELNNKEILSNQDKIEIEDHFYCDVEDLVGNGLSTREALLVARSRFGELNGIREDYEVVKPEENILYFVFMGVLLFSVMKGLLIAVNMTAQIFWSGVDYYTSTFLENHLWFDIPLRISLLAIGLWFLFRLSKRNPIVNFSRFWYVPLVYVLMEVINRVLFFLVMTGINKNYLYYHGDMLVNEAYMVIISTFLASLFVSFKLFKLKKEEHKYV